MLLGIRYQSFSPETELVGFTVLSLITNITHTEIRDILHRHGLAQVDPQQWYPLQQVLDVLSDVAAETDHTTNFVSIGMAAAEQSIRHLPPEIEALSLEQFILLYPQIYKSRMRCGELGYIQTDKVSDTEFVITLRTPFPDNVMYGLYYAFVRHFLPQRSAFTLKYDPQVTPRDEGGEVTIMRLTVQ